MQKVLDIFCVVEGGVLSRRFGGLLLAARLTGINSCGWALVLLIKAS